MNIKYHITPLLFVAIATPLVVIATMEVVRGTMPQKSVSPVEVEEKFQISQYDDMLQEVGERHDVDWLLLSAIARAESEFRFDAVSKAGAVGLMQVMPSTARSMGYTREALFDARVNAEIAAQLLHENNKMLRLSHDFDKNERLKFILACYNAGYSRIADARRLARYHEDDADTWNSVASYLSLLAEPEFAEHEVVQSGEFYGSDETIAYVNRVMHIYRIYRTKIVL